MIPEEETREWIHDWIAHLMQFPGEKPTTALVMRGEQGTGKSTLADIVRSMFLDNNTIKYVGTDQFVSKFNKRLAQSLVVVLEEAVWSGNHQHMSLLKGYITEERFAVQDKGVKSFIARNYSRFIILSNEEWAVPADGEARRFCVVDVPQIRPTADPWWKKTQAMVRDDRQLAAVLHWYQTRKITANINKPPQNEALAKQKRLTRRKMDKASEEAASVVRKIMQRGSAFSHTAPSKVDDSLVAAIPSAWLLKIYEDQYKHPPSAAFVASVAQWLTMMGLTHKTGAQVKRKGKKFRALLVPTLEEMVTKVAAAEGVDPDYLSCQEEWTFIEGDDVF